MIRAVSIGLGLACVLALPSLSAIADEGDACVLSYENAQVAKKKHDMVSAKAEITLCEHACPTALAKDCEAWVPEVEAGIGEVALSVKRRDGTTPAELTLFLDEIETPLGDGKLELNLGDHTIRVESPGMKSATTKVTVAAGAPAPLALVLDPRPVEPPPGAPLKRSLPAYPFVIGGIGLALTGAGGALGLVGQIDVADMRSTCAKTKALCAPARVNVVREEWIAGGVLAGVGVATVAVAVVLLVTAKPSKVDLTKTALSVPF